MGAEVDLAQVCVRLVGRDRASSSQARASLKPAARSSSSVSAARRSARGRPSREVGERAGGGRPRRRRPGPPRCCPRRRTGRRAGRRAAARARSRAKSRSWSAIQWKVAVESTASTRLVDLELDQVGDDRTSTRSRRRARSRAASIIDGDAVDADHPAVAAAGRAAPAVTRPEPQPASRTVSSPAEREAVEDVVAHRLHRRGERGRSRRRPSRVRSSCLYVITYRRMLSTRRPE